MQSGLPIDIEKRHFLALGTTNNTADLTEWNTEICENRADIPEEIVTTKQGSRPQMCCSESGLIWRRGVTCVPDLPSVHPKALNAIVACQTRCHGSTQSNLRLVCCCGSMSFPPLGHFRTRELPINDTLSSSQATTEIGHFVAPPDDKLLLIKSAQHKSTGYT